VNHSHTSGRYKFVSKKAPIFKEEMNCEVYISSMRIT